ncbi:hypothetical protein [Saccharothrix lopnurensis]|uniref:Uncharacterized protein n=1 Tax=Saccharothrix lopnurensis TaxID=1670621 RepID=A0ABW1P947_9PSEU
MIANDDAVRAFPQLARLVQIKEAGWAFCPFPDERGAPVGLVGWQSAGDTTDALWIFDRDRCRAARLILGSEDRIDWEHIGDPEPRTPQMTTGPRTCFLNWITGWPQMPVMDGAASGWGVPSWLGRPECWAAGVEGDRS